MKEWCKLFVSSMLQVGIVFLLCLISPLALSSDIVSVGSHYCCELKSLPKHGWIALHEKDGSWFLSSATASVVEINDGGLEVSSSVPGTRYLLRDASVKEQDIELQVASKIDRHAYLAIIHFRGTSYSVTMCSNHRMEFRVHETWQLLGPDYIDSFHVKWAGDLDGDGALDLIVSSYVQGGGTLELYLSRGAGRGGRLRKVASRWFDT